MPRTATHLSLEVPGNLMSLLTMVHDVLIKPWRAQWTSSCHPIQGSLFAQVSSGQSFQPPSQALRVQKNGGNDSAKLGIVLSPSVRRACLRRTDCQISLET